MKIQLGQIPTDGLQRQVELPASSLPRVVAALGEQQGTVRAAVRLRNHQGNVEVRGQIRATITAPCQRCLDPVELTLEDEMWLALVPRARYEREAQDIHLGAGDLDIDFYDGEEIDLQHLLEDEVLLLVPDPVTEEDDDGRCTVCGRTVAELFPEETKGEEEHPFFEMKRLLGQQEKE